MDNEYPIYELKINPDDESQVDAIALVDHPAIESEFLAFGEQREIKFELNDDKMELIGPAMIPDMKIYRFDADKGGYYVYFTKDTVRKIAQTFFKKNFQGNLNLDHSPVPAGSYVFQSYIVDESKGITSPNGMNLTDGSWVIGVKVDSPEVWADIKAGKRKGFSVEGMFELKSEAFDINLNKEEQALMETLLDIKRLLNKKGK